MNIDKAVRYHRLKRRTAIGGVVVTAATLTALLATGASVRLRDFAAALARDPGAASSPATIAIFVVTVCALMQAVALPLAYYSSLALDRRYGLSAESPRAWLKDYAKGALLSAVLWIAAAELVYVAIREWPRVWWIAGALGCGLATLALAGAAPIVLLPLFYRFKPLDRPLLQERLRRLSQDAGMPVLGAYEWGLGEKTRRANAALVGVGTTRRILLSDTLLADYSDDEIEAILAHELGHHAHRDVLKGVAAQTGLLLLGFGAAAAVLHFSTRYGVPRGLAGTADVAGLPLLLLAAGAVSVALTPVTNALSRLHERRADAYALRLTQRPSAFISAMRRLAAQNLSEPQPSRTVVRLFHSHPPVEERIRRAEGKEEG